MSVKHYQIGDRIRGLRTNIEGRIESVHELPGGIAYYTAKANTGSRFLIIHQDVELIATADGKYRLYEADRKQFEELAQYMDRVAYGAWARTVFGATAKPQPKFKVGDGVQHKVNVDLFGKVIKVSEISGVMTYHVESPSGTWYSTESYLEPTKPTPKLYTATYRRDDGLYGLQFEAHSQADAEAHCAALGMTYGGIVA